MPLRGTPPPTDRTARSNSPGRRPASPSPKLRRTRTAGGAQTAARPTSAAGKRPTSPGLNRPRSMRASGEHRPSSANSKGPTPFFKTRRSKEEAVKQCTKAELRELEELFELMDDDGSGVLDEQELTDAIFYLCGNKTTNAKRVAGVLLKQMDADHSGGVDFSEFVAVMCGRQGLNLMDESGGGMGFVGFVAMARTLKVRRAVDLLIDDGVLPTEQGGGGELTSRNSIKEVDGAAADDEDPDAPGLKKHTPEYRAHMRMIHRQHLREARGAVATYAPSLEKDKKKKRERPGSASPILPPTPPDEGGNKKQTGSLADYMEQRRSQVAAEQAAQQGEGAGERAGGVQQDLSVLHEDEEGEKLWEEDDESVDDEDEAQWDQTLDAREAPGAAPGAPGSSPPPPPPQGRRAPGAGGGPPGGGSDSIKKKKKKKTTKEMLKSDSYVSSLGDGPSTAFRRNSRGELRSNSRSSMKTGSAADLLRASSATDVLRANSQGSLRTGSRHSLRAGSSRQDLLSRGASLDDAVAQQQQQEEEKEEEKEEGEGKGQRAQRKVQIDEGPPPRETFFQQMRRLADKENERERLEAERSFEAPPRRRVILSAQPRRRQQPRSSMPLPARPMTVAPGDARRVSAGMAPLHPEERIEGGGAPRAASAGGGFHNPTGMPDALYEAGGAGWGHGPTFLWEHREAGSWAPRGHYWLLDKNRDVVPRQEYRPTSAPPPGGEDSEVLGGALQEVTLFGYTRVPEWSSPSVPLPQDPRADGGGGAEAVAGGVLQARPSRLHVGPRSTMVLRGPERSAEGRVRPGSPTRNISGAFQGAGASGPGASTVDGRRYPRRRVPNARPEVAYNARRKGGDPGRPMSVRESLGGLHFMRAEASTVW